MSRQELERPNYVSSGGSFSPSYHTDMIRDTLRVSAYEAAIKQLIKPNMRVLEVGAGSGILSILAAKQGAAVTALEIDPRIADIAASNYAKNNVDINLILGDAFVYRIDDQEKYDLVLSEMMSTWCIEEPQVLIAAYARKHWLKPNGLLIPEQITNLMNLSYFEFGNSLVQCRYPFTRFTGVADPLIYSETLVANQIDLYSEDRRDVTGTAKFNVLATGLINCVQISSLIALASGINFYTSDTLMPITIVPLQKEIYAKSGDQVTVNFSYSHRDSMQNACFSAEIVK